MSAQSVQMLLALAFGFAAAGLCASGYRLATSRLPNLGMLEARPSIAAVCSVPLLVVSAPFLIMRNALNGRKNSRRFEAVFLATVLAGFWSLMSGIVMVMVLNACGLFLT